MAEKVLITSALPYANGPLHFGHIAGAYLPADCYARFERMRGKEVVFICGSDEHGVAITLSAELAKKSPKEHVDFYHAINQEFFKKLSISFDHYSRTTWEGHIPTTHQFFSDLYKNGYLEKKEENHLFSEKENRFLADRYVIGTCPQCAYDKARGDECPSCGASYEATDLKEPRSKITGAPLILKPSEHWYLRFDLFRDKLLNWIKEKPWKENVLNFSRKYIEDLKPRAISRDGSWGIPIGELAPGKVFYVWFDAPIGYISATKQWAEKIGDKEKWEEFWLDPKTSLVQFVGKDNIPFHTVFFPAMIMGQNVPYKLPDQVPANEFLMLEGKPFSKSEGWSIDLETFFSHYTPDQIRYTLAANAPETSDSDFSWKDFQMRCNSELLGKLGNFVHRTLCFAQANCQGKVPPRGEASEKDLQFLREMEEKVKEIESCFASFRLRMATQILMELSHIANVYFDSSQPWVLKREEKTLSHMHRVIYFCIQCIRYIALAAYPIIPDAAEKIWKFLGYSAPLCEKGWKRAFSESVPEGQPLLTPSPLFRKIEDEEIEREIALLGKNKEKERSSDEKPLSPLKKEISFPDFEKLDLRVGVILEAKKIPKSKKLLEFLIDLGFEKRSVVSGIAEHYTPEEMLGKRVIVIANLKPAKLMGVISHGMILAAEDKGVLELPSLFKTAPGAIVS